MSKKTSENEEPIHNAEQTEDMTEATENVPEAETAETVDPEPEKDKKDGKSLKKLKTELEEAKKAAEKAAAESKEVNDKYLRILAEYDNFRRRSQTERDGIYTQAYSDAVEQLLPIYDNIERAIQYAEGDEKTAEGLKLLEKSFMDALSKMGISKIDAVGKPFDPEFHNAVLHVEDETLGENTVMEVLQNGFIRGDKVIRYAMVKVAN